MLPLSQRAEPHRWPAMRILGAAAGERLGHPLADCELAELYSCFPVAVRVQQRELDLPREGTPTVTGGMSFAGGPFNSFVLQATTTMVRRLRESGGRGVVTSVSGLLTKPGLGVWSVEPDGRPPLIADLASEAAAATGAVPVVDSHDGPATVVAATVTYDGMEPAELVALLDTPAGARVIARWLPVALGAQPGVPVVEPDDLEPASDQLGDEVDRPRGQLGAQAHDEQQRLAGARALVLDGDPVHVDRRHPTILPPVRGRWLVPSSTSRSRRTARGR